MWDIYYSKKKKILLFFKIGALFLFIAQKIETAEVIKYHQKKALFVGKKGRQFCLGATSHDQLSVKATQCRIAKPGRVL